MGQHQGDALGLGQLSALDKAEHGRGIQAGHAAKVQHDVTHRRLLVVCYAGPKPFKQRIGRPEEEKTLQLQDIDVPAQVALQHPPVVGAALDIATDLCAGEGVVNDVDAAVVQHEQDDHGRKSNPDPDQEIGRGDDNQNQKDDGVFGR